MKKLNLITEFDKYYRGSDLQKIVRSKPLPFKYTINGTDCYFYNADLFGLFEWKIKKDGLTTNDFIDDYKKGFEAGLLHLENDEQINLKDLKSKDLREGTISQLQYILFEREFKTGSKGLLDLVFNKVPLIFTEKVIYDFGYRNGIIYTIDEICEKAGIKNDELTALPLLPINESPFSVLEWATIFYYADVTKLLPENRTIKARIEQFINKYEIDTTYKYFRTQYYEAKKRINCTNDYPVSKLELIIPFLKENYKQTVIRVENDITYLEEEKTEY